MAPTPLAPSRRSATSATSVAPPALLLLLVVALVRGESSPSAADTDSGGGLGTFLRRLMLDLFAWLGSLFGLGRGSDDDAPHYAGGGGGGGDRHGSGRFPPRGQRVSTASPQDVEHIGEEEVALSPGSSTDQHPEFSESSEERSRNANAGGDANASPEGSSGAGVSAEQLGGDGMGRLRDASVEVIAGGDANQPTPARVTN